MLCKHCGTELRKTARGCVCPSPRCQLVHDKKGKAEGWVISVGNVPGYILRYEEVLTLWRKAGNKPKDLHTIHAATIVEMSIRLGMRYHEDTLVAALRTVVG